MKGLCSQTLRFPWAGCTSIHSCGAEGRSLTPCGLAHRCQGRTIGTKKVAEPEDVVRPGVDGISWIWREAKFCGNGRKKTMRIVKAAMNSIGLKEGLTETLHKDKPAVGSIPQFYLHPLNKKRPSFTSAAISREPLCHFLTGCFHPCRQQSSPGRLPTAMRSALPLWQTSYGSIH